MCSTNVYCFFSVVSSNRHKRGTIVLRGIECGYFRLYAPRVGCFRKFFKGKMYYYVLYGGKPVFAKRLPPPPRFRLIKSIVMKV